MDAARGPSRRGVLAGVGGTVAALALGGCTNDPEAPARPAPDDLLRDAAIEREQELLAAYDAVLLTQPALTARLLPLREEHLQHLTELRGPQPSASASPSPQPAATGSPPAVPAVPAPETTAAALATLAAAESDAAASHGAAALAADARPLAVLLASVSASEQSHPVALA